MAEDDCKSLESISLENCNDLAKNCFGDDFMADVEKSCFEESKMKVVPYEQLVGLVYDLAERLEKIEAMVASTEGPKWEAPSRPITRKEMEEMVMRAIQSGPPEFGISKRYIWAFLRERHNLRETIHYQKKLNVTLRGLLELKKVSFDSSTQLFKAL